MKVNVCIVTYPLGEAGYTPLSNLVKLLSKLARELYVISGGVASENIKVGTNVQVIRVNHKVSSSILMRIINDVRTQLAILCYIIQLSRKTDFFIFFIGAEDLIIPMLALRLLWKKVLLMPGGVATKVYAAKNDPLSNLLSLSISINASLAYRLIVYSHTLTSELNFIKYRYKIIVAHEHFVDFTRFTAIKNINEKTNQVGYLGRLSNEKGIISLIEAIPFVLKVLGDTSFVIGGNGILENEIKKNIKSKGIGDHVKLMGWIAHEDIPQFLNELKLLVVPSFTEGLPNVILEAMACGIPVLATPVGAIQDIINDGRTGFILKSNGPEHIADRITEVLNNPQLLEKVSSNAYKYIGENFSEEKVRESWQRIFKI